MNKPDQPNHWNCLAAELGAESTPNADNKKAIIGGSRADPTAEPAPPRAVNQSRDNRSPPPATDWDSLAGELGLRPESNSNDDPSSESQPNEKSPPLTGSQESSTELGTPAQTPSSQPWPAEIEDTQTPEVDIPDVIETTRGEVPQLPLEELTQTDEELLEAEPLDPQSIFGTAEIETSEAETTEVDAGEDWSLDDERLPIESAPTDNHEQGENVSESAESLSDIFGLSADDELNDWSQPSAKSVENEAEKRLEMIFDVDSAEKPDSEKYDSQLDETAEERTDQTAAHKDDSDSDGDSVAPQSRQHHQGDRKRKSSSPTDADPGSLDSDSTDPDDIEITGDNEDESSSTNTTRKRRRRRRRGGRSDGRGSDKSNDGPADESNNGSSDEETDFNAESKDVTTTDAIDKTDNLDTSQNSAHRKIPSWQDAIGTIVSNNIASRSRQSRSEGSKGRGRGRGRGSKSDSKK